MAAFVSGTFNYVQGDGTSPDSVAFAGSGPSAGSLLVCMVEFRDYNQGIVTGGSPTVGSTNNGTWTRAVPGSGVAGATIYYKENCAGGADTVTVNWTTVGNATTYIQVAEFTGIATSSALDDSDHADLTTYTTLPFPALTVSGAGVIIAIGSTPAGSPHTNPATGYVQFPYTASPTTDSVRQFCMYKIATGPETSAATIDLESGQYSNLTIANFLDASGGSSIAPLGSLRIANLPAFGSARQRF